MVASSTSRLLALPAELRLRIYKEVLLAVLSEKNNLISKHENVVRQTHYCAALITCRQIYNEAAPEYNTILTDYLERLETQITGLCEKRNHKYVSSHGFTPMGVGRSSALNSLVALFWGRDELYEQVERQTFAENLYQAICHGPKAVQKAMQKGTTKGATSKRRV